MITLDGAGGVTPPGAPGPERRARATRSKVLAGALVVGLIAILVAALVGGGLALVQGFRGSDAPPPAAIPATTAAPTTTGAPPAGGLVKHAANTTFHAGPTRPELLRTVGPMTITVPGTVLSDVHVMGALEVHADHVTVHNFIAENVVQRTGTRGMVLEDGTIDGGGSGTFSLDGITWGDYTVRRLDISHSWDGLKAMGNVTIENCWIHDLNRFSGPSAGEGDYSHNDGVQSSGGSHVTIRDNRIERPGNNSAVFIDPDQGPIDDVTVTGNYLDGGSYTLYAVQSRRAPTFGSPRNVVVRNNVFGRSHVYGAALIAPRTVFRDNVDLAQRPVRATIDKQSH